MYFPIHILFHIFSERQPFGVTIIGDSMIKHIHSIDYTTIQSFPGATISRLQGKIQSHQASIFSEYTIVHIGTNDIPSSLTSDEIISLYENLITFIRSHSGTKIIISSIIPRPCDLPSKTAESRLKIVNRQLESLCLRRKVQCLKTYRIFLKYGKPIRSLFAVKDGGLHLNLEGSRRLRQFFINTITHLS